VWGRGYLLNERVSETAAKTWASQPAVQRLRSVNS